MIPKKLRPVKKVLLFLGGSSLAFLGFFFLLYFQFNRTTQKLIYPGITIGNFTPPYTKDGLENDFAILNQPFSTKNISFQYDDQVATVSATELELHFDGKLSYAQAYSLGRSGHFVPDFVFRTRSLLYHYFPGQFPSPLVKLSPALTYKSEVFDTLLADLRLNIDKPVLEPLFEFEPKNKRVAAFRLGENGLSLNQKETIKNLLLAVPANLNSANTTITVSLAVDVNKPKINPEATNDFGIVEELGRGESFYRGSIPGRIHNLLLAASRINGVLVPPGETFSFNATVGDISAATGYKSAYIIKSGRTVLGDGGGVCQVSTTLFRAALNSGLEIVERSAHSYRVGYYEQGGYKPGLDATVFGPSIDLKIRNNTNQHILIEVFPDPEHFKLSFAIYGKKDGRIITLNEPRVWGQSSAPAPLYQDDPTLPAGVLQQVDWAAGGAKTSFDYKVEKDGQILFQKTFYSNFQPWQAVFLRGTKV